MFTIMINVLIHTDTRYPVNRKIIRKAVEETLKNNKASNLSAEVSVAVVGSRKMRDLSEKYLKDDKRHQVLSFSFEDISESRQGFVGLPDDVLRLGEIVLCWPEVIEEASRDDEMVDDKVYELTSHGVEHLLGKHHE